MKSEARAKPSRILFYSNCLGKGGAHQSMLAWFDLLRNQPGIELQIYCAEKGWFTEQLEKRGLPYTILAMPAALGKIKHGSWQNRGRTVARIFSMLFGLAGAWVRAAFIRTDVVVLTGGRDFIMLLPLVLRKHRRTVTVPQTTDWGEIPTCKTMCRIAARTYAISESVADSITAMGISKDKVTVLPLIYTADQSGKVPEKQVVRRELGIDDSDTVIGMTGVIRPHKGQLDAIRILAQVLPRHPNARLVIAGAPADTPESLAYHDHLHREARDLGVEQRVLFLGWRNDVPRVMRAMDLMLVPSHDFEGVPRVILEALEAGLPLVASDLTQFREVIGKYKAGALFPVKEHALWAEEILRLTGNPSTLRKASEHARNVWRATYSEQSASSQILGAFSDLAR